MREKSARQSSVMHTTLALVEQLASISGGAWPDHCQAAFSERVQSRQCLLQPGPEEEGASVAEQGRLASPPDSPLQPVQSCSGKRADSTGQALPVGSGSQDGLHVSTELQSVPDAQHETEGYWMSSKCQLHLRVCAPVKFQISCHYTTCSAMI